MKIVCFGDSLTRGETFVKGRLRIIKENYPTYLQGKFQEKQNESVVIVNKGVFNDNSELLLNRLEKDVIVEQPDYVIIGIGGNDCNFYWDQVANAPEQEHAPIVPVEKYLLNIKTMIEKLKNANITPIIMTLPPLDPVRYYRTIAEKYGSAISHLISNHGGIEHWHGIYNRSLKALIGELNVPSIDVRTALKKSGDLQEIISPDGIHLTSDGYRIVSDEIYHSLSRAITSTKMVQMV